MMNIKNVIKMGLLAVVLFWELGLSAATPALYKITDNANIDTTCTNVYSCLSSALAISQNGKLFAFVNEYGRKSVDGWTLASWEHISFLRDIDWVEALAISPDGKLLAIASNAEIKIWNIGVGEYFTLWCNAHVTALTFKPHGNILASGDIHGKVTLWNLDNHKCIKVLNPAKPNSSNITMVRALAFKPNGNIVALFGFSKHQYVGIWDLQAEMEPNICTKLFGTELFGVGKRSEDIGTFSPDGSLFVVDHGGSIFLWDVEAKQCIHVLEPKEDVFSVDAIAFSPDGMQMAIVPSVIQHQFNHGIVVVLRNLLDPKILREAQKQQMLTILQGTHDHLGENSPVYLLPEEPLRIIYGMLSVPTTAQLWRKAFGK